MVMQRKMGASFGLTPVLNEQFIFGDIYDVAAAPFAVADQPIMVQHLNKITASRLMPVFGTPSF